MEAYKNPALSPEKRAEDLIGRMTLREKVGQLTQRLYGFGIYSREGVSVKLSREFTGEVERYSGLGTLYGLHRADPWSGRDFQSGLTGIFITKVRNQIQRYVIEHSRLGIPVLFSSECPHGHQALDGYLLPVNLASACGFSPELLEETAKVCGGQLKRMGVDLALVSALDVLRDPRWGRSEECFGEDPHHLCPEYEAVRRIVGVLMEKDGDLMACLQYIVALFGVLSLYADWQRDPSAAHLHFKPSSLQELIRWTNENYARKITIDEVAKLAGYS